MDQQKIEVEQDRIILVLHKGPLSRPMSTMEAKRFAMDQTFGGLLYEVNRLADIGLASKIPLEVREALEVR